MNKKYIFIIFIILFLSIFSYLRIYNSPVKIESVKDSLIKNLNWDSPLQKEVPYVIWNKIELYYILDYASGNNISIDLSVLRQEFEISSISIWENNLEISDQINFSIHQNTPLKISWIAKNNSNKGEQNLRDLIDITSSYTNDDNLENTSIITKEDAKIEDQWLETATKDEDIKETNIDNLLDDNLDIKVEIIPEIIDEKIDFSWLIFNKNIFNSNINNLLEISWKDIDKIKFLNIWSYSFSPNIKDWVAYILIKQNTFDSWNYFVFIQPLQWGIIPLETQMSFEYNNSKVNIANITPNQVNNSKDSYIVLQWNWFSDIISLQLNNNIILEKTDFDIINDKVMSVKIDKKLDTGIYSFNIMTTDNIIQIDNMNFTIIK